MAGHGETHVPVIDVSPLLGQAGDPGAVARAIDAACRDIGFFSIVGHGVDPDLRQRLDTLAREFFALDDTTKAEIEMARGGRAWRGWFPVGGELTSGVPDRKEGIYFGRELSGSDPRVLDGRPLHGPNLFPRSPRAMRDAVLAYLDALTELGQAVLSGIALALGLDADWFRRELTAEPTILFRIFRYPPSSEPTDERAWGVAEHTDYGLLTILGQDGRGGLEVRSRTGWILTDSDTDAFVCNIGDMLERMTGGVYRSTPHRVKNTTRSDRLSFPFFIDPGWDVRVRPVPGVAAARPTDEPRWDGVRIHDVEGTYGEYLVSKVSKVFPGLGGDVL